MNLNELRDEAHGTAKSKGWWDDGDRNPLELHMLMVSGIAEATECARKDERPIWRALGRNNGICTMCEPTDAQWENSEPKPEGEAIELADVLIRIGDYFGRKGWDLEQAVKIKLEYNKTRPHRHGGKKY